MIVKIAKNHKKTRFTPTKVFLFYNLKKYILMNKK